MLTFKGSPEPLVDMYKLNVYRHKCHRFSRLLAIFSSRVLRTTAKQWKTFSNCYKVPQKNTKNLPLGMLPAPGYTADSMHPE